MSHTEPVRIFVGATPDQLDLEAEIALENSIRSRSSLPVSLTWMRLSRDPSSPFYSDPERGLGHDTRRWMTPFTRFRWMIPKLCNYQGRGIYLDYDTLVLADIAELWRKQMNAAFMARQRNRACTMLIDCERAGPEFSEGSAMECYAPGEFWNCFDGENMRAGDPRMKILHFTTIDTQPHLEIAAARLSRQGKSHWFKGPPSRHWRPDLLELWAHELTAGRAAGYGEPGNAFGPIPLASVAHYRGMRPR